MKLNPKISEAKTRALFNRNIAAIWDKLLKKKHLPEHLITENPIRWGFRTRTMRDISVSNADVEANPGNYMGHSINRLATILKEMESLVLEGKLPISKLVGFKELLNN